MPNPSFPDLSSWDAALKCGGFVDTASSDNTDDRVNASGVPPGSSYNTDDRVDASGVLALSPVDVRMPKECACDWQPV
jgi:hypothetical protein